MRIGCSGWQYNSWRGGAFYPEGLPQRRWLEHYASVFDTVEVNSTFYRLARENAVRGWAEQTPPGFCFAIKASRYLTHIKRLAFEDVNLERFYTPLTPLLEAGKLAVVLWQLPPNFKRDDERLVAFLDRLDTVPPTRHAFEVRHQSWFVPEVYARLHEANVALVSAWHRDTDFPRDVRTADFAFHRFHYGARGRRGNYSQTELDELADVVRGEEGYAYFNNDWEAFAPHNAIGLNRRTATAG